MRLVDKVKEQAAAAAKGAKEAASKGQAKVEEIQAKRAADATLRELGLVVYLQRVGRAGEDAESRISGLVETLRAHEAENGDLGPDD